MRNPCTLVLSLSLTLLLGACTFVPLTPEGEQIKMESAQAVTGCERKGTTSVSTKHKLGFVPRSADIVTEELQSLARNDAAKLGGNTIVPETQELEGQQTFAVYQCRR